MTRRVALDQVGLDPSTNLSSAFELFPKSKNADHTLEQIDIAAYARGVLDKVKAPTHFYEGAFTRRKAALLESGARCWGARCTGRFVVGLGDASVRQTGLRLLRPWGVPYLPGSALKGVAAKAAHLRGGDWSAAESPGAAIGKHHEELFGSVDLAGLVTFHDAWWVPATSFPIHADVMTVHHSDYYGGRGAPLDTDSPNPVSFLSANGDYLLALSGPEDWVALAFDLLKEALERDGIGAKTAAGYGRFDVGAEEVSERETQKRRVKHSLASLIDRDTGPGTRQAVARELLEARGTLSDDEVIDHAVTLISAKRREWKDWLTSDKRTEEERWLLRALERASAAVPVAATPTAPTAAAAPKASAEHWVEGVAELVKDRKNKLFVRLTVEGRGKPIERERKDVEPKKAPLPEGRFRVRARLEGSKLDKLVAIEILE